MSQKLGISIKIFVKIGNFHIKITYFLIEMHVDLLIYVRIQENVPISKKNDNSKFKIPVDLKRNAVLVKI